MIDHVKILGILHIVFSGLALLAAAVLFLVFGGIAGFLHLASGDSSIAAGVIGVVGAFLVGLMIVLGLPGVIVGIGLLGMQPWARIAGLILSALELLHVPFGTILGVYGLWVLLDSRTERLFSTNR